jgi:hypothetical protein
LSPSSKLGKRDYMSSKSVWKRQFNEGYETNYSAYCLLIIFNPKQSHYIAILEFVKSWILKNEIRYNPATFLLVVLSTMYFLKKFSYA